jgi:hypothetical protein
MVLQFALPYSLVCIQMKLQVASLLLRGNYENGHGGVACTMTGNDTPHQFLDPVLTDMSEHWE